MDFKEYQELAARTIRKTMSKEELLQHSMLGMVTEVGELCDLYKDKLQNDTPVDEEHEKKEMGDILWFFAERCTAQGWDMEQIASMNIDKLRKRFPDGFTVKDDLNRKSGDV